MSKGEKMKMLKKETGQGLLEYVIMITITAIIVLSIVVLMSIFAIDKLIVPHWNKITTWETGFVNQIQRGNPGAIFEAVVIAAIYLWLIRQRALLPMAVVTVILITLITVS